MNQAEYLSPKIYTSFLALLLFLIFAENTSANPIAWPGYHIELSKEKLKFELDHTAAEVSGEYYFSMEDHLKNEPGDKIIYLLLPIYVDKDKENRIDNELKVLINNEYTESMPVDGKKFIHILDSITPYYCDIQWYQIPLGKVSNLGKEIGPIVINYKQKIFEYGRYKYFIYTPLFNDYIIRNNKTQYSAYLKEFIVTINNNFENDIELTMGENKFRRFNSITFSMQKPRSREPEPIVVKIRELNGYTGP